MSDWLPPALAYIPQWLDYQTAQLGLPGASIAIAKDGAVVLAHAQGVADQRSGEALTPAHRFRVASHSKTFTTAGILRLVDAGRLRLDERAGTHVPGLHPEVARAKARAEIEWYLGAENYVKNLLWLGFTEVQLDNMLREAGFREIDISVVDREPEAPYFQTVFATGVK